MSLAEQDDPAYRKELAQFIDDRHPAQWIRWSDARLARGIAD